MCTYPVSGTEVDSLSKVISLVEASMIGPWEGDHKLASTLIRTYNLHERYISNASELKYLYIT